MTATRSQRNSTVRWLAWVWYRGESFCGFQRQPGATTVQSALEGALYDVGVTTPLVAAGRTDRGTHARMQVIAFRADWPSGAPALTLPEGLGALLLRPAPANFHPQWSASGKTYRYRLAFKPGLDATWDVSGESRLLGRPVDLARVEELLAMAVGARDFGAFHPNSSPRRQRVLEEARLHELPNGGAEVTLHGDGFARHQVRYLVGTAVAVAAGVVSVEQWRAALERAEPLHGLRAPAHGLTLWEVHYPDALDPFSEDERGHPPGLPYDWPHGN